MSGIEFLANMNISPKTVKKLKDMGLNIVRVSEVMDCKSKDRDIINYARLKNKILITQDVDYSELLSISGYNKPSVIILRLQNVHPDFVASRIFDVVSELREELKEGIIVSADERYVRFRNLPIGKE